MQMQVLPPEGLVRFSEIKRLIGFSSHTTMIRRLRAGAFPPPKVSNGNIRYWDVKDIREYISGKKGGWGDDNASIQRGNDGVALYRRRSRHTKGASEQACAP